MIITNFVLLTIFILGAIMGSFINMLSYRLPRKIDIIFKKSHCPKCHNPLKLQDLLPIISWLWLKGRCRKCQKKIPLRYFFTELTLATHFLITFSIHGPTAEFACLTLISTIFWAIIIIDLENYIICDELLIASLPLALTFAHLTEKNLTETLISPIIALTFFIVLSTFFKTIMNRDALGFGDVKFFAICFIMLKISQIPFFLFFTGIFGIITAIIWQFKFKQKTYPFAPAIALSCLIIIIIPFPIFN